jgi:hypothetical protein
MHHFDPPPPPPPRHREYMVWTSCVALLVVPAILAWFVRGTAYAMSCAPGPDACRGIALGGGMRDALNLGWTISLNTLICVLVSLVAALAALKARHPLLAALTMLLLPTAALALPAFAVFTVTNADCMPNEAAVGECVLWGTKMGMSVHNAVMAEYDLFGMVPYTFALALMVGVVGFLFFRPRPRYA